MAFSAKSSSFQSAGEGTCNSLSYEDPDVDKEASTSNVMDSDPMSLSGVTSRAAQKVLKRTSRKGLNSVVGRAIHTKEDEVELALFVKEMTIRFRSVISGRITIDPGAGEIVCPIDMVFEEKPHQTDNIGTRYRVDGGQTLVNQVGRRVKSNVGHALGSFSFQAINEVKKPLASAAKITNKGNIIVPHEDGRDSHISNKKMKKASPTYQEHNFYVMSVDFMTELNSVALSQQNSEVFCSEASVADCQVALVQRDSQARTIRLLLTRTVVEGSRFWTVGKKVKQAIEDRSKSLTLN